MIIDYADCEAAAEFALNDMVEREYSFVLTLTCGEVFNFIPLFIEDGVLTGHKADENFKETGEELEIPLDTIEKVEC